MTVPIVTAVSPSDGATDISIATTIVVTFNTAVKASTVTEGTLVVYRADTFQTIDGTFDVNSNIVTFRPYKHLYENTSYGVGVMGEADNNPGGEIKSLDTEDSVQTTTRYYFRTEVEQYSTLEQVQERADIGHDGPIRVDDITEPGGLKLQSVYPRGFSSENSVDLDEITFTFSSDVDASTVVRDSSIFFDVHPALGMEEYYAAPTGAGGDPILQVCGCTGVDYTQPTGTFTVTGSQIIWNRGTGEPEFNYNSELQFTMTESIKDTNGQSLLGDTDILMSTEYYPKLVDARVLRLECGAMLAEKNDDTINRMLHKNSIEAWDQAGWKFDLDDPTPAARRWVRHKTVVDLFDLIGAYSQAHAGIKRELADLRIEYPSLTKLPYGVRVEASTALEKLTYELRWYRGEGGAQVTSLGKNHRNRELERSRTWAIDYSPSSSFYGLCRPYIPAHNLDKMRLKKLRLSGTIAANTRYVYGTTTSGTGLFACTCPS